MQEAFAVLLVVLAVIGGIRRDAAQLWTPLIMVANQAACTAVVLVTGDYYPVLFLVVADYASAIAMLLVRRSHWQSAIIGIYACQIICHAAYALSDMGVAATYYGFWALTYMGWVQLALVGGWIGTSLVGPWLPVLGGRFVETRDDALARDEA